MLCDVRTCAKAGAAKLFHASPRVILRTYEHHVERGGLDLTLQLMFEACSRKTFNGRLAVFVTALLTSTRQADAFTLR